jgi:hypothetical protein
MRSKYGWQRWIATATLVSALAAPAAHASPVDGRGTSAALKAYEASQPTASADTAYGSAGGDFRSPDARATFEPGPGTTVPVAQVSSGGFEWSDAGIGAAAMLGAIALGLGALLLLSGRRRERHLPRAIS